MKDSILTKCVEKGVKLTDQRKIIAKIMSESHDHPDVDELYKRVSKIDSKISIATVYRTVKLFEEAGILAKHDFKGGKARYEELNEGHHDHLIDIKSGEIIEFVDNEIEKLQKKVAEKYIMPPKTTDFAIVYAPIEGLFAELSSYRDPKTKELLMEELRTKYKVTIAGPNTLCAILQAFHMGFHTLKVQKHATQIHDDLKNITNRFVKHFSGIVVLRKKIEEAMRATDDFWRDARSITRILENIKSSDSIPGDDPDSPTPTSAYGQVSKGKHWQSYLIE